LFSNPTPAKAVLLRALRLVFPFHEYIGEQASNSKTKSPILEIQYQVYGRDILMKKDILLASRKSLFAFVFSALCLGFVLNGCLIRSTKSHLVTEGVTSASETPPTALVSPTEPAFGSLISHSEALTIADSYIKRLLGSDFVIAHLRVWDVEERKSAPSLWFVIYEYSSHGYQIQLNVTVDRTASPQTPSRIVEDVSRMIASPQEVTISLEEAESRAAGEALAGPYTTDMMFHWASRRLVWAVKNPRIRAIGETMGYLVDAETGQIIATLTVGVSSQ
jgi:hypothetical protein